MSPYQQVSGFSIRAVTFQNSRHTFWRGQVYIFIFAANEDTIQQATPFPPFGIPTLTILSTAAYLVLVEIYNPAKLARC
jgi:hypothetical protein